MIERGAGAGSKPWWLIVECESGWVRALVLRFAGGRKVLPVFSFGEEAELFLALGATGLRGGWLAKETAAGELASLLLGPLSGVTGVAFDPLPGRLGGAAVGLVSTRRQDFVARLLAGGAGSPFP